ncbi:MAG: rod shape-determining protein RodA [Alphaproteobacteria bacterium]|nr:rod shape-determining protein RodA [Alphaproteobacteria bacterium]
MSRLFTSDNLSLSEKVRLMNWGLVALIVAIGLTGVALLYSAGSKSWEPWALPQLTRFSLGLFLMIGIALTDIRFWLRYAYLLYGIILVALIVVEIMGHVGMGAQRWINLGIIVVQPSELMKIALVLALAKYFHGLSIEDIGQPLKLLAPVVMVLVPVGLVLAQPNLGTALLLTLASGAVFFVGGVRWWKFVLVFLLVAAVLPFAWDHLHAYQKARLTTFLNPDADPLGNGYNILQSKIAMGSGGLWGRGFGQGTQSQLQFLPEKHTDFIFVVLAEEFGMVGALFLLFLYFLLIAYGFMIALTSRNQFGRLAAFGLTTTLFLYVFVNVAMVTGIIPVVGIPLPLVSYGGTAMLTLLVGCGILLSISIHRDMRISRTGLNE